MKKSILGVDRHPLRALVACAAIGASALSAEAANLFTRLYSFGDSLTDPVLPDLLLDPATTAYWDGIHPTAAVHQIIAAEASSSVPESSVGLLAMLACGLMLVVRRRV
ncbi:MAG: phospholipase/lecithinase/hemolysin [Verrucomicrobiales bacterium]|jgi:phospholipase/lecithinase/hemolysin